MRQTTATIERIRELLITSGVPEGEVLEEMLDHYLSDIESQIDLKISSPLAIQATFQKIEKTDFSSLQKKKKSNRYFALVFIFLLLISGWVYQNSFSPNFFEIIASSKEIAPDGWPLKESAPITSNFGLRLHPILKSIKLHKGIDIRAKLGTLVLATGTAVVRETGYTASVGNYIILEHNGRFSSRYCHLSAIHVKENEIITKGSIIGEVGSTGNSSAPHLHYEIIDGDAPVDPLEFTKV